MSNEKMTSTQMPERVFGARTPEEQEKARVEIENRTSMLHAVGKPIRKKDAMQLPLRSSSCVRPTQMLSWKKSIHRRP